MHGEKKTCILFRFRNLILIYCTVNKNHMISKINTLIVLHHKYVRYFFIGIKLSFRNFSNEQNFSIKYKEIFLSLFSLNFASFCIIYMENFFKIPIIHVSIFFKMLTRLILWFKNIIFSLNISSFRKYYAIFFAYYFFFTLAFIYRKWIVNTKEII